MGYYTSYEMDVKNVKSQTEHEALYEALSKKDIIGYAFYDGDWSEPISCSSFRSDDMVKWYEHDEDMLEISRKFPDMTFKLYGTGDDPDDRWYALYKNGEMEKIDAVIIWPEPTKIDW